MSAGGWYHCYRPTGIRCVAWSARRTGSGTDAVYDIDPAEAAVVRRIFTERAAGASIRSIGCRLQVDGVPTPSGHGVWGQRSMVTILERAVYWTGQHELKP